MRIVVVIGVVASAWTVAAVGQTLDHQPKAPAAAESSRSKDEPSPSMETITKLAQDHAFKSNPNLNRQTEFRIRETKVKGLWDAIRLRVFTVDECDKNSHTAFNQFLCVYHHGKVRPFGAALGGNGLTSGVILHGNFITPVPLAPGCNSRESAEWRSSAES